ncbi:MAG: PfkB family carbohydrate kinase [Verrucomicrobiales bacterium]
MAGIATMITADRLQQYLRAFRDKRILVVGDMMLDRFLTGNVSRISPEAPVPVVEITREVAYPGGAANVARNLVPFAGKAAAAGLVGKGLRGEELIALMRETGIDTTGILRGDDHETIVKTRIAARGQQIVRLDRERRAPLTPARTKEALEFLGEWIPGYDAIIIEDYAKGFITQDLADGVCRMAAECGALVAIDPNPGNPLHWHGATAIKPNLKEAMQDAAMPPIPGWREGDHPGDWLTELGKRLLAKWDTQMVLVTLGEHGMALFERGADAAFHIPTRAKEVFDVSGAGDTAIALFTLALSAGAHPHEAAEISNHASGIVVAKSGTATLTPEELVEAVR